MSNTFITPTMVVRDASLMLMDNMLMANLCTRSTEEVFARKVGESVKVKVPPSLGTADEFSSTTSASALTETSVDVTLEKHFYKRVDLTSDELTEDVDDFNTLVVIPAVNSLIRGIEAYGVQKASGGFAPNLVGTAGTEPSTHAHIVAGEKKIFDLRGDTSQLVGILSSTAFASFAQLNIFASRDYGDDRPQALQSGTLGRLANIDFFRSPNAGTHLRSSGTAEADLAGTVTATGTAGEYTLALAAFTSATGTVYEGTRFTVAGDATVYTTTANATKASNACTVSVTPVLASSPSAANITLATAYKTDLIYNPRALACAVVPGAIVGPNVAAASINGVGLRIISDVSTSTLAGTWVFDLYCGFKVVRPEYGCVFQG